MHDYRQPKYTLLQDVVYIPTGLLTFIISVRKDKTYLLAEIGSPVMEDEIKLPKYLEDRIPEGDC